MSRTVTALYDTRAEAEAACERLKSGADVEGRAKIIDQSSTDSAEFRDARMTSEDRHAFGEGLKRGGFMLCAEVDGDEHADKIISLLDNTNSVDLDERQAGWRNEGWQPYAASSGSESGRDDLYTNRGTSRIRSYAPANETASAANSDASSRANDGSAINFGSQSDKRFDQ